MKVLLISPAFFAKNSLDKIRQFMTRASIHGGDSPPLGLGYIAATARKSGYGISILDMRVENKTKEEFSHYLESIKPDLVGFYVTTFNIKETVFCARFIKESFPKVKIIVGGPNMGIYPVHTFNHKEFDLGLMGEADNTFPLLLDALQGKGILENIPGLIYRKNDEVKVYGEPQIVDNLDEVPFPARELLKGHYIYFGSYRRPYTTMMTSRGCPYNCAFCGKIPGEKKIRFLSSQRVVEEFEEIVRMGYREVNLYDDIFTVRRNRVLEICQGILDKKLDITWSARTRIDSVNEEMLILMKKAGCQRLYFGIESGTDQILKLMNKRTSAENNYRVVKMAHEMGFEVVSYFIIGFPGETDETMQKTIDFAKKIPTDFANFNMFEPLPASKVHDDMIKAGLKDQWLNYLDLKINKTPIYAGPPSHDKVEKFYKLALKEFYLRPKTFWNLLKLVKSFTRFKNFFLIFISTFSLIFLKKEVETKS